MIVNLQDALYPQYNLPEKVEKFISENNHWLKEQADKRLSEPEGYASPEVLLHWHKLAGKEIL